MRDETTRLVAAAWTVLERSGFEGFKVQLVLRETGLSARSFYRHFADKDALLLTLMEGEYSRSGQRLQRVVAETDDPVGQVQAWIRELILAAGDERRVARARLFSAQRPLMRRYPVEFARASRLLLQPLEEALERGRDTGAFVTAEPTRDAELIHHLAGAAMNDALMEGTDRSIDAVIDAVSDFALRALGARPNSH